MGWLRVEATKKAHRQATAWVHPRVGLRVCEIESERALRAGIAVLAGHGIVLAKDGLHGGEVGLEVAVGGAALGVVVAMLIDGDPAMAWR